MSPEVWVAVGLGALAFVVLGIWTRDERGPALASPDRGLTPPSNEPLEALRSLLPSMDLADRDTDFFGRWSEGRVDGCRVAFQAWDKGIAIFAGDFDPDEEQLSETYLGQVSDVQPLPEDGSSRRLSAVVGADALGLDARFVLNATGGIALGRASVRDALERLSERVEEVMLFESRGVELLLERNVSARTLASDLDVAIALHRALVSA